MRKCLYFVSALLLVFMNSTRVIAQDAAQVPSEASVPVGYKTYSLFLICSPKWLNPEKDDDLRGLYSQFKAFGRVIGDDHVAIWFWKDGTGINSSGDKIADALDVERSARFCKAWNLKPSAGPHLVVTSTYPDEPRGVLSRAIASGLPKNSAVYELGGMTSKDISALMGKLTDELAAKGRVDSPSGTWAQLLEATRQTLNSFGCAWSFKVDAGPVNATLQSCKGR